MSWIQQNIGLATALIAGVSAILGGLVAAAGKFVFDFYLSERVKRRWRTIDVKRRYAAQIIRAADDLAGRLGNLARHLDTGTATKWLGPVDEEKELPLVPFRRYYFSSTVYLFARLIGWIEVLKREQIFLDFATITETRRFNSYLELIYSIMSYSALTGSDIERQPKNHWIYYHYLGGIGESLFAKNEVDGTLRCLTFHEFCSNYKSGNSDFRRWLAEVEKLVISLQSSNGDVRWRRIQMLRICLDAFLDFADPKKLHTTRSRLESRGIPTEIREQVKSQANWFSLVLPGA